jgi:hypothetical protein
MADFSLVQLVSEPTHEKGNILDLVFLPCGSNTVKDVFVCDGLSDHAAIQFSFLSPSSNSPASYINIRSFKNVDQNVFSQDIFSQVVQPILDSTSNAPTCEDVVHLYNSDLTNVVDKYAPLK